MEPKMLSRLPVALSLMFSGMFVGGRGGITLC
jgi:hypothetical protein